MVDKFNVSSINGQLNVGNSNGNESVSKNGEPGQFKNVLMQSIDEVNKLQADADDARMKLTTGKTENVAEVFTAVKKAELAFQTLMQIRNKLSDAYEEIKQMRV